MRKYRIILLGITMIIIFTSCKDQNPSADEWMKDPQHQDEAIAYILDDYPLMMKFLDKSIEHDRAQSMMLGHKRMMNMMMFNHEMMGEIIKSDTALARQLMQELIESACTDSVMCSKMTMMLDHCNSQ